MNSKIISATFAIASLIILAGCKIVRTDNLKTVTRTVPATEEYTTITNRSGAEVTIQQGTPSITITAPEDVIERYNVTVSNGALVISQASAISSEQKANWIVGGDQAMVRVEISMPSLTYILSQGSGDIQASGFEGQEMEIFSQGSGDFNVDNMNFTSFSITSQGSGDMNVKDINAKEITFQSQGSGDVRLTAITTDSIRGISQGSGDITISGIATKADLVSQGSGDINDKGLKIKD